MKKISKILVSIVLALLLLEGLLRLFGFQPWKPVPLQDDVVYYPKSPFALDTALGYKMLPGIYDITYGDKYKFRISIDEDGYRKMIANKIKSKRRLLIFGDSFTLGSGLNDGETYPSHLQNLLTDFQVKNFGIAGYGIANVYKQMTHLVRPNLGDICIYSYFKQHNNRYGRIVKKMMYANPQIMGSLGFLEIDKNEVGQLVTTFQPFNYKMFFLSPYSSLVNLVEDRINLYLEYKEEERFQKIGQIAIKEMAAYCRSRGATFVLCGIRREDGTAEMLDFCKNNGILALDISVDLTDSNFNQMPYDDHPNALSNRIFANRIFMFMKGLNEFK